MKFVHLMPILSLMASSSIIQMHVDSKVAQRTAFNTKTASANKSAVLLHCVHFTAHKYCYLVHCGCLFLPFGVAAKDDDCRESHEAE